MTQATTDSPQSNRIDAILEMLYRTFNGAPCITFSEFREFFGISRGTDWNMRKRGRYPRTVANRILIVDLADWLEKEGDSATMIRMRSKGKVK